MSETQQESEIPNSRLLNAIDLIEKESATKGLTLGELVTLLGEMGHGILILLLCLFFLQPIPIPGLSTPIGAIIIISAVLQFMNKAPWIPKSFRHREISQKALHKVAVIARKIWARIERLLHPRLLFLTRNPGFRFLNLVILILSACLLALPLPIPFTNTIPAVVILSIVFAQLEDDGFMILFSYFMSVVMVAFFFSLGAGVWNFAQRPWTSLL